MRDTSTPAPTTPRSVDAADHTTHRGPRRAVAVDEAPRHVAERPRLVDTRPHGIRPVRADDERDERGPGLPRQLKDARDPADRVAEDLG